MVRRVPKFDLFIGAILALPVIWLLVQLAIAAPRLSWTNLLPAITGLTLRTLLYDALATAMAFALAAPAIIVLARASRASFAFAAGLLLCALLQPPVVYLYGWSQFFRLAGILIEPQSAADILRCIFTLATWLWPIPAAALGLALRSLDPDTLEAARLDGGQRRITFRQVLLPIIAAGAITLALALQQFTVFEQTNIPVIATEARTVFSIGSIAGHEVAASDASSQSTRIAASAAVSLPVAMLVFALAATGRRLLSGQAISLSLEAQIARPQSRTWPIAVVLLITLGIPLLSMRLALAKPADWSAAAFELLPQLTGSLIVSGIVAGLCLALGIVACAIPIRWTMGVSIAAFLAGGQILALGMIHLLNRPSLGPLYDSAVGVVMTHAAMFAWISLLPARLCIGEKWRDLRMAAISDGAGRRQYLFRVALPATWRWHVSATLVVFCLSFGEIPAVMLLQPQEPQMLLPMLMTWVHLLRYDAMIEGALLLAAVVLIATLLCTLLISLRSRATGVAAVFLPILVLNGCGGPGEQPDETWQPPEIRPLIYPRGIAYSRVADEFFVVDRVARIQRISSKGAFVSEWQMPEQENGRPVGISVGPDGNVYIPDTHYYRVMVFSPTGQLLRQWGKRGTGPGEFLYLTDVAFDSAGNVFVSEYGDNDRVQVFSPEGEYLYEFGRFGTGDGEFARPQSMVIDDGLVYITDAGNHRIVVFTTAGKFVRSMGSPGSAPGEYRFPYGLDQDIDGNLVVTEFGNNRVQKVDRQTGGSIAVWGKAGRRQGELAYPWASAVDTRGRVAVLDSGNNRLQIIHFR